MSRLLKLLLIGAIVFSMASMAEAKKITIKAVTAWPKSVWEVGNFNKFMEMVKENVEKKYPGELEIQYLGGPEVIPNQEQVEAARMGVVDMVFTTDGYYVSAVPEINALSVSMLDGWEEREKGVNAFLDKLHREKINCVYLGRLGHNLPFTIYLMKSAKGLEDLKGLKIRCSPTLIGFLKKIGANPVVIPPPEVYTALERGVVDGFTWPGGLIKDWGWDKMTKYVVQPGVYNGANVIVLNQKKWEEMPEPLQKLLIETLDQAARFAKQRSLDLLGKEKESLKAMGVQYLELSPAEAKVLTDAAYSALWDVILEKSPVNGAKLREMVTR